MKPILISLAAFFITGTAAAAIPTMNYTCPTGIELHIDQGGEAYLNGKAAKLKVVNEYYFEVKGSGVVVSVATNPDGSHIVSYTGKNHANGMCSEADFSKPAVTPAAKKTATAVPSNLAALCKGEAAGQFNTKPTYVQVGKPFASNHGFAVKGKADLGNQGEKAFQCNFDQKGKLHDFQSLVNEGSL